MEDYFEYVVSNLTIEDMSVLGVLLDFEADAAFKAIKNQDLLERSDLTETTFRKVIIRLLGNRFVEFQIVRKQHAYYITPFGVRAIKKLIEGESA